MFYNFLDQPLAIPASHEEVFYLASRTLIHEKELVHYIVFVNNKHNYIMIHCRGKEMENVVLGYGSRLQKKHPVRL